MHNIIWSFAKSKPKKLMWGEYKDWLQPNLKSLCQLFPVSSHSVLIPGDVSIPQPGAALECSPSTSSSTISKAKSFAESGAEGFPFSCASIREREKSTKTHPPQPSVTAGRLPYKIPRTVDWGVPCRALMHATSPLQGNPLDTFPPSLPFARHLPTRWCLTLTQASHYIIASQRKAQPVQPCGEHAPALAAGASLLLFAGN